MNQPSTDTTAASAKSDPGLAAILIPILLLTATFLINFTSRVVLGPLLPVVEEEMGANHAQAGSLFLFVTSGYFISIICSGFVSSRIMHRGAVILSSTCVGVVMLALSLTQGMWALSLGLFVLGMAAGFYLPSGIATITELAPPNRWGMALAIHELAPNLGFVICPLLVEVIMPYTGWRGVLVVLGVLSLLAVAAFTRWGRGGRLPGQAPNPANLLLLFRRSSTWLMMLLFSLGVGASLGVYTMLPLFLVSERGHELSHANMIVAASRVAGVGAAFVSGWVTDRLGPVRAMAVVLAVGGLLTIALGVSQGGWMMACLFLQPTVAVCFFPAGFAALSQMVAPEQRNLAVAVTIPMGFMIGGGAIPAGIGWLGQHATFSWGLAAAGLAICSGCLVPLMMRRALAQGSSARAN